MSNITNIFQKNITSEPFDWEKQGVQVQFNALPTTACNYRMHMQIGSPGTKVNNEDKNDMGTYVSRTIIVSKQLAMSFMQLSSENRLSFRGGSMSTYNVVPKNELESETIKYFTAEHGISFKEYVEETWAGVAEQPQHSREMFNKAIQDIASIFEPAMYQSVLDDLPIDDDTPKH